MFKVKISFLISLILLFSNILAESAFARAGGRSSSSGGGRMSYSGSGNKGGRSAPARENYSPTQNQRTTPPQSNPNLFQKHPFLSMFGAGLAGSWLGHMLFGSGGGYGAGGGFGGGGLVSILIIGLLIWFFVRKKKRPNFFGDNSNEDAPHYDRSKSYESEDSPQREQFVNTTIPESEKKNFTNILVEVQHAWSLQDFDKLKKVTTPEMLKYFADSLNQNKSQGFDNVVKDVEVLSIENRDSWREDELEYATVLLSWSSIDYTVDTNNNNILDGSDKSKIESSELWTFVRYSINGKWLLSAIDQVD